MTKQEAMEALKEGKKVTHRFFSDHEYIYLDNGVLKDEDGNHLHNFWHYHRTHENFDRDWSIFEDKTE